MPGGLAELKLATSHALRCGFARPADLESCKIKSLGIAQLLDAAAGLFWDGCANAGFSVLSLVLAE